MDAISQLAKQGRWTIESVSDLGAMTGKCSICGSPLRYEYHVHPVDVPAAVRAVGSTCGPTLVQASWSEAYWTQIQADFEMLLGRKMTPDEIEKKKKETSKAQWKQMAKDYIAKQQEDAKKTLPTMLERYVALRPWHRFASSILGQLKQGRRLTPKQIDVATGMIAETDWDALEAEKAAGNPVANRVLTAEERELDERGEPDLLNRMNWLYEAREKMPPKSKELVGSFMDQLSRRGSLSPKQLEIVAELEQRYQTNKSAKAKPVAVVDDPKSRLEALLNNGHKLTVNQRDMLQSFKTQAKPFTARQVEIINDIFKRLGLAVGASPAVATKPVDEERQGGVVTMDQMNEDEIPF